MDPGWPWLSSDASLLFDRARKHPALALFLYSQSQVIMAATETKMETDVPPVDGMTSKD